MMALAMDFPLLNFHELQGEWNPSSFGRYHGETFRESIKELAQIRRQLLLEKNPALQPFLKELSEKQWRVTQNYAPKVALELQGIQDGAGITREQLTIINNYTDFRDITGVPDKLTQEEGCTTAYITGKKWALAGQTWDMHGSAKNYLCVLQVQGAKGEDQLILSLLGCVGLMGYTAKGLMVGVNNINTDGAIPGMYWPALVRRILDESSIALMEKEIQKAPVTSGHSYIIGSPTEGSIWEVAPKLSERTGNLKKENPGVIFHTNHCLGPKMEKREAKASLSSTTFDRFKLAEKNLPAVLTLKDFKNALQNHENYPKSLCSHFATGTQDPSMTCGGGVGELSEQNTLVQLWRGCPEYDKNYRAYSFKATSSRFTQTLV